MAKNYTKEIEKNGQEHFDVVAEKNDERNTFAEGLGE